MYAALPLRARIGECVALRGKADVEKACLTRSVVENGGARGSMCGSKKWAVKVRIAAALHEH